MKPKLIFFWNHGLEALIVCLASKYQRSISQLSEKKSSALQSFSLSFFVIKTLSIQGTGLAVALEKLTEVSFKADWKAPERSGKSYFVILFVQGQFAHVPSAPPKKLILTTDFRTRPELLMIHYFPTNYFPIKNALLYCLLRVGGGVSVCWRGLNSALSPPFSSKFHITPHITNTTEHLQEMIYYCCRYHWPGVRTTQNTLGIAGLCSSGFCIIALPVA